MPAQVYDIAVIGGGVNGCGIARDAAGRGLKVLLVEQNDLASGTSSMSTKLIHGGLRYLEQYEFKLVRESLIEREILWQMAPHIIQPLRFVLPHSPGLRPAWLIRIGLFLYDHIGGRKLLPASHGLDLTHDPAGKPLKQDVKRGFEYSDCRVDDARLVVLNAMDARAHGADLRPRTRMLSARRTAEHWDIELGPGGSRTPTHVAARILVNAAGPWVGVVADHLADEETQRTPQQRSGVHLVKGSHIVVPRLYDNPRAYIFQTPDGRIVFAIPYQDDYTLIGTTDVDYNDDPGKVCISDDEVRYLCAAISSYFIKQVTPADVIWSFSGLRPLFDEGDVSAKERSRDYVLELDAPQGRPPLLTIFGGKITTYRHLAEDVLRQLTPFLPAAGPPWTRGAVLPGGDFPVDGLARLQHELLDKCPDLGDKTAARLVHAYGTLAADMLGGAGSVADLGRHFGAGLYQREVDYLIANEWAASADDILWRRCKLGLRFSQRETRKLQDYLKTRLAKGSAAPPLQP